MMDKTQTPHGIFFQATMKNPEAARSFFQSYLNEQKIPQIQEIVQAIDWDNLTLLDKIALIPGKKQPIYPNITYHTFTKLFIPEADIYLHGLLHIEEEGKKNMELPKLERSFLAHFEQSNKAILLYHEEQYPNNNRQPIVLNCVLSNRNVPESDRLKVF